MPGVLDQAAARNAPQKPLPLCRAVLLHRAAVKVEVGVVSDLSKALEMEVGSFFKTPKERDVSISKLFILLLKLLLSTLNNILTLLGSVPFKAIRILHRGKPYFSNLKFSSFQEEHSSCWDYWGCESFVDGGLDSGHM